MSFGFSVSDFITVGELAWRLYRDCYKVAHGAPQEFQLLVGEISTLSNSLSILQEEVKDPQSTLVRAGEDRVRMVNEMVKSIYVTLKSLEKVAKKYEILGSSSKRKHFWAKFKWSMELTSIDGLRNKLVYHNTVMNLLLTSIGNSSLQRIESSTDALENDVREIKSYITGQHVPEGSLIPSISAVDDESEKMTLSASLMQNAEILQPWSTIGVDQWIESGRWWLIRSQMELYAVSNLGQEVPLAAYTSLIKASWILIDIIACHPQVPFLSTKTHAEVQILSTQIKSEFQRLGSVEAVIPDLRNLETQDLRIWESQSRGPLLRPHKGSIGPDNSRSQDQWQVDGGEEVIFQSFATLKLQALPEPVPCIILFLANEKNSETRLLAQNQNGSIVMATAFEKEVHVGGVESETVCLNDEQVTFASTEDARMLRSVIEGTNFFYFGTKAKKWTAGDLRSLILTFAVKAQRRQAATRFSEKLPPNVQNMGNPSKSLPAIASRLADEHMRGTLNESLCGQNKLSRDKIPLFQWAIECNHVDLATLLVSKEPTETSGESWRRKSPLGLACRCGHEEIARLLVKDANTKQPNDGFPLHLAAKHGHTKIVRLLLRNGAEVDAHDKRKMTALSCAARKGYEKTVELLIDRGADIESKGDGSHTPLHEACKRGNNAVILVLAEEGARFDQPRDDGETPYHVALQRAALQNTFDIIASKYYAQTERPVPSSVERVAELTFDIDSDWAMLTIDSDGAYFDHPDPMPENVDDKYQKYIRINKPLEASGQFWKWAYRCKVRYRTNILHFSTGHGGSSTSSHPGRTTLTVVGSNGTGPPQTVTTTPTHHSSSFRSHWVTVDDLV